MRNRRAWVIACIAVLLAGSTVLLLLGDPIRTSASKAQRDFEMRAHARLLQSLQENGLILAAFETDGCSGGLSAGWRIVAEQFPAFAALHQDIPPWETCCVTHDRAYHSAGTAANVPESYDRRLSADRALRKCVFDSRTGRADDLATRYGLSDDQVRAAYEALAEAMFQAVRIGGLPCSSLPWRWGYGFPRCPGGSDD